MPQFKGSPDSYRKIRPNYPTTLFLALIDFWKKRRSNKLGKAPIVIDVGCGTGIASRGISKAFHHKCKVFGIEPNISMLSEARDIINKDDNISYLEGSAEKLPFKNKSADIVMAAQAIHYFDRPIFYQDAKRILHSNGVIAILENNRNWRESEFLERYESLLEKNTSFNEGESYKRDYRKFFLIDELNQFFQETLELSFPWIQRMTVIDFLELARSTTSAQRAMLSSGKDQAEQEILSLAQEYSDENKELEILYTAKLYLARNS